MNTYKQQAVRRMCRMVTLLLIGSTIVGCTTTKMSEMASPQSRPDSRVIFLPGDQIDIKFFYTPELNDLQVVRPDGKISLQLIGDVVAAGLSPSQLQTELQKKYTGLIEKPSATVIARELVHRNVYIGGSVKQPGLLNMPGHTSALAAIMSSGGFDMRSADPEQVHVIRHENGARQIYTLNFKEALNGESIREPFYLHAQDIVYVPRTGIVKAGQWIDQYITQLIPKTGFSWFFNTDTGDSIIGMDTTSKY